MHIHIAISEAPFSAHPSAWKGAWLWPIAAAAAAQASTTKSTTGLARPRASGII